MPPRKKQPLCEIVFGQLRIPVMDKEQGKKVIEGIFMIGETSRAERPMRKAVTRKRVARGRTVSRKDKTAARRELVGKLFEKGLNKSQIMKETGASFMTVAKDLEFLGKGKETKPRGKRKAKKQVKAKAMRKVAKGSKGNQPRKPPVAPPKEEKKEGE